MRLKTINVVEIIGASVNIYAFTNDIRGRTEANELFKEIALENQFHESELEKCGNGMWDDIEKTNWSLRMCMSE